MLRAVLLCIGILLLGVALLAVLAGCPARVVLAPAFFGAILTASILFERRRYKPASSSQPGPDWVATDEQFVDPTSGDTVTVFYHPATGQRRYRSVERPFAQCVAEE
jgi:hypothetical protein